MSVSKTSLLLAALCGACGNADKNSATSQGGASGAASAASGGTVTAAGGRDTSVGGTGAGATASGGAGSGGSAPTEFDLPFPLGAPGFRDSTEPFCDGNRGNVGYSSVWADERGVFAVIMDECLTEGRDLPFCTAQSTADAGISLSFNDGNGWRTLLDQRFGEPQLPDLLDPRTLSGFDNGSLLVRRNDCAVATFDASTQASECSLSPNLAYDGEEASVFAVNDSLAFHVDGRGLYQYSAGNWSLAVAGLPEKISAVWASDEVVYLAGEYQPYVWPIGAAAGELKALPRAPVAEYTSVWGFGRDDVWFGSSRGGLTHYDGASYTIQQIVPASAAFPHVAGLWGTAGTLYVRGYTGLWRLVDGKPQVLMDPFPDPEYGGLFIRSMWGTSPNDVFLALSDYAKSGAACGSSLLLHFDGAEFHRF
ncbi:MAG: hypothetical protein QM756_38775 [Polyangiaceae bacterium]